MRTTVRPSVRGFVAGLLCGATIVASTVSIAIINPPDPLLIEVSQPAEVS